MKMKEAIAEMLRRVGYAGEFKPILKEMGRDILETEIPPGHEECAIRGLVKGYHQAADERASEDEQQTLLE